VDDSAVLAVLADADRAGMLPQLGGMARPNGVAIVSPSVWCFSDASTGDLRIRPMPRPRARVARLPFLRGLVKVASALVPMLSRNAAARPHERLLVVAAMLAPLPLLAAPAAWRTPVLLVLTVSLIGWMLRGRTLRLHGAEHRAIAAAESRSLVATWHGAARPSRISPRCGTNFAALLVGVSLLLERAWFLPTAVFTPALVTLVSLMVTMEIWLAAQRPGSRLGRVAVFPGMLLQRLTTREPTLEDTRVALRAVAGVLAAD
jgi:uncharacterized protein YqhQ